MLKQSVLVTQISPKGIGEKKMEIRRLVELSDFLGESFFLLEDVYISNLKTSSDLFIRIFKTDENVIKNNYSLRRSYEYSSEMYQYLTFDNKKAEYNYIMHYSCVRSKNRPKKPIFYTACNRPYCNYKGLIFLMEDWVNIKSFFGY